MRHVRLITKMVGIVKSRRKICTELEDWRGPQEDERCNRDEIDFLILVKSHQSLLKVIYITFTAFFYQETSLDQVSQVVLC